MTDGRLVRHGFLPFVITTTFGLRLGLCRIALARLSMLADFQLAYC